MDRVANRVAVLAKRGVGYSRTASGVQTAPVVAAVGRSRCASSAPQSSRSGPPAASPPPSRRTHLPRSWKTTTPLLKTRDRIRTEDEWTDRSGRTKMRGGGRGGGEGRMDCSVCLQIVIIDVIYRQCKVRTRLPLLMVQSMDEFTFD